MTVSPAYSGSISERLMLVSASSRMEQVGIDHKSHHQIYSDIAEFIGRPIVPTPRYD